MRFARLHAATYGPLRDREFDLDSDLVLVHGPNEAGKSSFREALETLLFGFEPAQRDRHPLAVWSPDGPENLHLEAVLRLDAGETQRVERVLQQKGKLRIADAGHEFSGPRQSNRGLSWVSWLSREVFCELYSLELEQLSAIDPNVRADIDELLLPHTAPLPLRPTSEVLKALESDHLDLWRPDNRGQPDSKRLRAELAQARSRAAEASETERALRQAREERVQREQERESLLSRKRDLERERSDEPLLKALFELKQRQRRLGAATDLSPLGDFPLVEPSQLSGEIEELEQRLREPRRRLDQPELTLEDRHARVLAIAPEIEIAISERPAWEADGLRVRERRYASRKLRQAAKLALDGVISTHSDATTEAADALPLEALRAAQSRWAEDHEQFVAAAERPAGGSFRVPLWIGAAGLVLAGLAAFGAIDLRFAAAGAALMFGALLTASRKQPARRAYSPTPPEELYALFADIPVAESLCKNPTALQRLIGVLEGIQRQVAEARELEQKAGDLESENNRCAKSWEVLCKQAGVDGVGGGDLLIARLGDALAQARTQSDRVRDDRIQREEAERLCELDTPQLDRKLEHWECLKAALSRAVPECGDPDQAFTRVKERQDEEAFARRREAELRKDPSFAQFESDPRVTAERAPADAPWLPNLVAKREAELARLDEQLQAENERLGEITELLGDDAGSARARAEDEVCAVEEKLRDAKRERDRLALLDSILRRADREFREEHQPDVLRRASAYLQRVTDNRYTRIDLHGPPSDGLYVTPAQRTDPVKVGEPISRGTLDQIFLCLRLGLLDHLDEDRERLPLVLDDALLRMDDRRRSAVYDLLGEIAPVRQVFLMTCHTAIADEIARSLKVCRVKL